MLPNPGDDAAIPQRANKKPNPKRGKARFQMRRNTLKKRGPPSSSSIFGAVFAAASSRSERSSAGPSVHSKLYTALNSKSSAPSARVFQRIIGFVILFDLVVYIFSTEPRWSHLSFFYAEEAVTSTIFAVEYIARLAVCTESVCYGRFGPLRGRWKYMCSGPVVLDALATFPFFIELLSGINLPTFTFLRIFRVLRITRMRSSSKAMDAVWRVLYFNREILHVACILAVFLIIVTSVLMYLFRPRGKDVENLDDLTDFESISSTMVLSVLMLTGQGGPEGQLPWYTQIVVLLTGLFSIAMFAIPASMLTWGFEAEAERLATRAKRRALARRRGEEDPFSTSSSSSSYHSGSSDISTSDEEYMNIIGGGSDDEGVPADSARNEPTAVQEEIAPLATRVENLERSVAQTNRKLDMILQKLERS